MDGVGGVDNRHFSQFSAPDPIGISPSASKQCLEAPVRIVVLIFGGVSFLNVFHGYCLHSRQCVFGETCIVTYSDCQSADDEIVCHSGLLRRFDNALVGVEGRNC